MNKFLLYTGRIMLFSIFLLTMGIQPNFLMANNSTTIVSEDSGSFFPGFTTPVESLPLSAVSCDTRRVCKNGKLYTEKKVGHDCITVIILPSCGAGKVYDPSTCSCKSASGPYGSTTNSSSSHVSSTNSSCTKVCGKVWCEGDGTKYQQVLDRKSCSCFTVRVAKVNCSHGQVFDKSNCNCVRKPTTTITTPPRTTTASCNTVRVTASNGAIRVSGLKAPHKAMEVRDANRRMVFQCRGNCKESEVIPNMNGTYSVQTTFFNSSWRQICRTQNQIRVTPVPVDICSQFSTKESNGQIIITPPPGKKYTYTITVKDEHGKTVCQDITVGNNSGITFNQTNASCPDGSHVKAPGHPCNDHNPNTVHDQIQADGCTCKGTAVVRRCSNGQPRQAPGTACNDNNPYTSHDVIQSDGCTCQGKRGLLDNSSTGRASNKSTSSTIENVKQHSFYPNPAQNDLFINLKDYEGQQGTIRLVDHIGQVIQQLEFDQLPSADIQMNLNSLKDGIHYLNIVVDNKETITEKVVINRM